MLQTNHHYHQTFIYSFSEDSMVENAVALHLSKVSFVLINCLFSFFRILTDTQFQSFATVSAILRLSIFFFCLGLSYRYSFRFSWRSNYFFFFILFWYQFLYFSDVYAKLFLCFYAFLCFLFYAFLCLSFLCFNFCYGSINCR